jgi:hypothetical protein
MEPPLTIKTKQQPNASWKAWVVGERLIVFAKTKAKAVNVVKKVFWDGGKDSTRDFYCPE